jgi:hypothetical protein
MNLLKLPTELINYLANYLPYIYKVSLSFTCKRMKQLIKLNFREIVTKKLNIKIGEELLDEIKINNCCISGGFILACLYDTNEFNDIDIWISATTSNKIVKLADADISKCLSKGFQISNRLNIATHCFAKAQLVPRNYVKKQRNVRQRSFALAK